MKKFFQNRYTAKLMAGWAALLMLVCPMFQVSAEDLPPPTAAVGVVEPIEEKQKTEEIGTVREDDFTFPEKIDCTTVDPVWLAKKNNPGSVAEINSQNSKIVSGQVYYIRNEVENKQSYLEKLSKDGYSGIFKIGDQLCRVEFIPGKSGMTVTDAETGKEVTEGCYEVR